MLSINLVSCKDDDNDEKNLSTNIDYDIYSVNDLHTGNSDRYEYNVIIEEEPTEEDMKFISHEVVEKAKKETPFNAIVIWFYDYPEYIDYGGMTLGKAEYAPNGIWADAGEVKTGDYSSMEFEYDFMMKDWSKRLTQEEVDIFLEWQKLFMELTEELGPEDDHPEDDDISNQIAEEKGITKEEVDDILKKQLDWSFSNIKED